MSGFELVGLILGAVPVTIAALEQYKTAHEMVRYFKHKSVYIDRLIQALEEQKFCLESEFYIMLRAAGLEQHDIGSSNIEHLQTSLHRSDIAEELRRYLGRGYDPYRKALMRCETSLGEIVRSIGGLVAGSPSSDLKEVLRANESKEGKYQFKKRIKFSLRKDELERRISELIEATSTLRRLRETSASLYDVSTSSSRTITKFAIFLQGIQRHANLLYEAIAPRLACGCHHEHGAKLYLEGQSAALQKKPLAIDFRLAIEALKMGMMEGNVRYEIRITVLEDNTIEYEPSMRLWFRDCTDEKRRQRSQKPAKQSRVKFNLPQRTKPPHPPMTEVKDLCSSLDQARQDRKVLQVYLSPHGSLCSCHVPPAPGGVLFSHDSSDEIITLEEILQQTSRENPSRLKWTLIQRMNLSFNLASSLLQLYSTPWLSESWMKRNICFWRLRPSSQASEIVLAFETDRPFIVHRFSGAPAACLPYKTEARHQLLELGILLLEIRHKESFESWVSAHALTQESSYGSRYNAASMWLRESRGELELSYFDAAARCIECTFQTRSAIPTWEDLDFRKSVCKLVIKPLWSNCSTM